MSGNLRDALERIVDVLPFGGPRPGSNAITYITIPAPRGNVDGEEIAYLLRAGLLRAVPLSEILTIEAGDNDVGAPDINLTHAYELSQAGREALAA